MANPTCSPTSLNLACFQGATIDPFRRKCLLIYFMAAELNAIGGTNYLSNLTGGAAGGLVGDAIAGLQGTNSQSADLIPEQNRVGVYELAIAMNRAVATAGISTAINTLMGKISCLINVNDRTLDLCYVWLLCQLGVHKNYAQ